MDTCWAQVNSSYDYSGPSLPSLSWKDFFSFLRGNELKNVSTYIPELVFIFSQCSIIFTLVTQLLMTGEFNPNLLNILIEELERTLKWKSLPCFDSKEPNVLISDVLLKLYMNTPHPHKHRTGCHHGEDGVPGRKQSHQMKWHTFLKDNFPKEENIILYIKTSPNILWKWTNMIFKIKIQDFKESPCLLVPSGYAHNRWSFPANNCLVFKRSWGNFWEMFHPHYKLLEGMNYISSIFLSPGT